MPRQKKTLRRRESVPGPAGRLAATIETPIESTDRWALLCHGFGSRKEFKPLAKLSAALAAQGWGVVRFDFAGHGASEGVFHETTFFTQQEDVRAVHAWMKQQGVAPQLVAGHSLGGATLLAVGAELHATHFGAVGAPADTKHLAQRLLSMQPLLHSQEAEVTIAGVERRISKSLLEALRTADFSHQVKQLGEQGRKLLVLQPEQDDTVVPHHAANLAAWSGQPDAVRVLPGADHLLSRDEDVERLIQGVLAWLESPGANPAS